MATLSDFRKALYLDVLVRSFNPSRANWQPYFTEGEIASAPIELTIPIYGGYLHVPPYMHAVVKHPMGQIDVFPK